MEFWVQAEEGFREELASDTELDLQMKGSADFIQASFVLIYRARPEVLSAIAKISNAIGNVLGIV